MDVGAFGLIVATGGFERLSKGNPGGDHARRGGHGGPGHLDRGLGLAAGQRHQGDAYQRLRVTGVLHQHALAAERNLSQMAGQLFGKMCLVCLHGHGGLEIALIWTLG